LIVQDQGKVDEAGLKALGARGVLKPSAEALQVVLGPIADAVAMDIRAALDRPVDSPSEAAADNTPLPDPIARLLGGTKNIRSATHHHGRWRVELVNEELVSEPGIEGPIRQIARISPNLVHVLIG
jgi:PTS system N-acetylglucosamine-specific IIC component